MDRLRIIHDSDVMKSSRLIAATIKLIAALFKLIATSFRLIATPFRAWRKFS